MQKKIFLIFFKKGIDNHRIFEYTIGVLKSTTREWRNWQTRTFEGRVVHTVRVQVPFLAPRASTTVLAFYFKIGGLRCIRFFRLVLKVKT